MQRSIALMIVGPSLLAAACGAPGRQPGTIAGPPEPSNRFIVSIEGPTVLERPGTYLWRAHVTGLTEDVVYEWWYGDLESEPWMIHSGSPVLELTIEELYLPDFRIELRVRAADNTVSATDMVVALCPLLDRARPCPRYEFRELLLRASTAR